MLLYDNNVWLCVCLSVCDIYCDSTCRKHVSFLKAKMHHEIGIQLFYFLIN